MWAEADAPPASPRTAAAAALTFSASRASGSPPLAWDIVDSRRRARGLEHLLQVLERGRRPERHQRIPRMNDRVGRGLGLELAVAAPQRHDDRAPAHIGDRLADS